MEDNRIQEINDHYNLIIKKLLDFKRLVVTYVDLPTEEISEKHDQLSDLVLYIILLQIDIAVCCRYLLINKQTNNTYEMNYFTRALATHCSDIVKTQADKLLTRINAVIKIYNKLEGYGELVTELSENRIKLVRLGEKNIVTIDAVRNGLFAHRDGKGIAQNNAIDSIDTAAIATIADEIDKTLWAMMGGLIKIQQVLSPMLPTLVNGSWK